MKYESCTCRRALTAGLVALGCLVAGCTHNPVGVDAQPPVDFTTQVLPIFVNNCAKSGCHDSNGSTEMDLSNPNDILAEITPYDAQGSHLYQAITGQLERQMPPPPNPVLTRAQRSTIALWILQGAKTTTK